MAMQGIMNQSVSGMLFSSSGGNSDTSVRTEGASFQNIFKQNVNSKDNSNITKAKESNQPLYLEQRIAADKLRKETVITNEAPEANISSTESVSEELNEKSGLFDKVSKLLDEIASIVCGTLEISEEELIKRMEIMGITMMDLTNPQILKQIVLNDAGTDDAAFLLTNEGLASAFQDIVSRVNEMVENSEINKVQLQEVLQSIEFSKYMKSAGAENALMIEPEEVILNNTNNNLETKDNISSEADYEIADKKEIAFEAVKIDENGKEQQTGGQKQQNSDLSKNAEITQGQQFIDKIADAFGINEEGFSSRLEHAGQLRDVANQIIEQIKVVVRPAQTSMEIQLNPEHLGKVNLNIVSKDGALTAQFTTQNQIAKEAIESNIQMLRENLENQGIKVETIEVTVSEYAFNQDSDTNTGSEKKGHQDSKKKGMLVMDENGFEDAVIAEALDNQMLSGSGLNINYTA